MTFPSRLPPTPAAMMRRMTATQNWMTLAGVALCIELWLPPEMALRSLVAMALGGIAGGLLVNVWSGLFYQKWGIGRDLDSALRTSAQLGIIAVSFAFVLAGLWHASFHRPDLSLIVAAAVTNVLYYLVTTLFFEGSNDGPTFGGFVAMAVVGACAAAVAVHFVPLLNFLAHTALLG